MNPAFARIAGASAIMVSIAVFFCFSQAAEKKVDFTGYSSYSFGQIVQGSYESTDGTTNIDHYWSHEVYTGLGFHAAINERFTIKAAVEGKMWQPYPSNAGVRDFQKRNYSLWLDQGNASYSAGDPEKPWLTMTMGYFKYKYNPDARNLGEQMFRSVAYPGFVTNYFDFPAIRLLGYQAHVELMEGNLKADALIISESDWYPFGDFSPALVASYKPHKAVEIGGGVEFVRLLSVNSRKTTPIVDEHSLYPNYIIDSVVKDQFGNSTTYYDSSSYYTFKATKLMGRITLDPKAIFDVSFFGPEDGKLYGEVDVIGLKNYSYWYNDLSNRIPIMVGFNFPAFKLLDVLSLEFEHYGYPFSTSFENVWRLACPVSKDGDFPGDWSPQKYKFDDWKWSVYAKKTVFPGFSITLQVARDHMHTIYSDGRENYSESLLRPGQWWWTAKLSYSL